MEFHTMKRKSLQALCKKHNLPANKTNLEMADLLTSLLKADENPSKGSDEIETINESKITRKQLKRVTFCLEDEKVEFVDQEKNPDGKRSRRRSMMIPNLEKPDLNRKETGASEVSDNGREKTIRMTRCRAAKSIDGELGIVGAPTAEKMKSCLVHNSIDDVEVSEKADAVEIATGRSRRNAPKVEEPPMKSGREVSKLKSIAPTNGAMETDETIGRNKLRKQPGAEILEEVISVAEAEIMVQEDSERVCQVKEKNLRRSRRNASKGESTSPSKEMGIDEPLGKKLKDLALEEHPLRRSRRNASKDETNASTIGMVGSGEAVNITKAYKRQCEPILENEGFTMKIVSVPELPRRSRRNAYRDEPIVPNTGLVGFDEMVQRKEPGTNLKNLVVEEDVSAPTTRKGEKFLPQLPRRSRRNASRGEPIVPNAGMVGPDEMVRGKESCKRLKDPVVEEDNEMGETFSVVNKETSVNKSSDEFKPRVRQYSRGRKRRKAVSKKVEEKLDIPGGSYEPVLSCIKEVPDEVESGSRVRMKKRSIPLMVDRSITTSIREIKGPLEVEMLEIVVPVEVNDVVPIEHSHYLDKGIYDGKEFSEDNRSAKTVQEPVANDDEVFEENGVSSDICEGALVENKEMCVLAFSNGSGITQRILEKSDNKGTEQIHETTDILQIASEDHHVGVSVKRSIEEVAVGGNIVTSEESGNENSEELVDEKENIVKSYSKSDELVEVTPMNQEEISDLCHVISVDALVEENSVGQQTNETSQVDPFPFRDMHPLSPIEVQSAKGFVPRFVEEESRVNAEDLRFNHKESQEVARGKQIMERALEELEEASIATETIQSVHGNLVFGDFEENIGVTSHFALVPDFKDGGEVLEVNEQDDVKDENLEVMEERCECIYSEIFVEGEEKVMLFNGESSDEIKERKEITESLVEEFGRENGEESPSLIPKESPKFHPTSKMSEDHSAPVSLDYGPSNLEDEANEGEDASYLQQVIAEELADLIKDAFLDVNGSVNAALEEQICKDDKLSDESTTMEANFDFKRCENLAEKVENEETSPQISLVEPSDREDCDDKVVEENFGTSALRDPLSDFAIVADETSNRQTTEENFSYLDAKDIAEGNATINKRAETVEFLEETIEGVPHKVILHLKDLLSIQKSNNLDYPTDKEISVNQGMLQRDGCLSNMEFGDYNGCASKWEAVEFAEAGGPSKTMDKPALDHVMVCKENGASNGSFEVGLETLEEMHVLESDGNGISQSILEDRDINDEKENAEEYPSKAEDMLVDVPPQKPEVSSEPHRTLAISSEFDEEEAVEIIERVDVIVCSKATEVNVNEKESTGSDDFEFCRSVEEVSVLQDIGQADSLSFKDIGALTFVEVQASQGSASRDVESEFCVESLEVVRGQETMVSAFEEASGATETVQFFQENPEHGELGKNVQVIAQLEMELDFKQFGEVSEAKRQDDLIVKNVEINEDKCELKCSEQVPEELDRGCVETMKKKLDVKVSAAVKEMEENKKAFMEKFCVEDGEKAASVSHVDNSSYVAEEANESNMEENCVIKGFVEEENDGSLPVVVSKEIDDHKDGAVSVVNCHVYGVLDEDICKDEKLAKEKAEVEVSLDCDSGKGKVMGKADNRDYKDKVREANSNGEAIEEQFGYVDASDVIDEANSLRSSELSPENGEESNDGALEKKSEVVSQKAQVAKAKENVETLQQLSPEELGDHDDHMVEKVVEVNGSKHDLICEDYEAEKANPYVEINSLTETKILAEVSPLKTEMGSNRFAVSWANAYLCEELGEHDDNMVDKVAEANGSGDSVLHEPICEDFEEELGNHDDNMVENVTEANGRDDTDLRELICEDFEAEKVSPYENFAETPSITEMVSNQFFVSQVNASVYQGDGESKFDTVAYEFSCSEITLLSGDNIGKEDESLVHSKKNDTEGAETEQTREVGSKTAFIDRAVDRVDNSSFEVEEAHEPNMEENHVIKGIVEEENAEYSPLVVSKEFDDRKDGAVAVVKVEEANEPNMEENHVIKSIVEEENAEYLPLIVSKEFDDHKDGAVAVVNCHVYGVLDEEGICKDEKLSKEKAAVEVILDCDCSKYVVMDKVDNGDYKEKVIEDNSNEGQFGNVDANDVVDEANSFQSSPDKLDDCADNEELGEDSNGSSTVLEKAICGDDKALDRKSDEQEAEVAKVEENVGTLQQLASEDLGDHDDHLVEKVAKANGSDDAVVLHELICEDYEAEKANPYVEINNLSEIKNFSDVSPSKTEMGSSHSAASQPNTSVYEEELHDHDDNMVGKVAEANGSEDSVPQEPICQDFEAEKEIPYANFAEVSPSKAKIVSNHFAVAWVNESLYQGDGESAFDTVANEFSLSEINSLSGVNREEDESLVHIEKNDSRPEQMSEVGLEDAFTDINWKKDSSHPSIDRAVYKGNDLEFHGFDGNTGLFLLPVDLFEDRGNGLQINSVLSDNDSPKTNSIDEQEDGNKLSSQSIPLIVEEEAEGHQPTSELIGKKDVEANTDEISNLFTNLHLSSALKRTCFRTTMTPKTSKKLFECSKHVRILAHETKENTLSVKREQSANHQVGKAVAKRHALQDLQNSTKKNERFQILNN